MYVQVLEQENRVAAAKSNGWEIREIPLFYHSGALVKNTQNADDIVVVDSFPDLPSILLRWGQGVENTSVLQAEVESTPCTGDK